MQTPIGAGPRREADGRVLRPNCRFHLKPMFVEERHKIILNGLEKEMRMTVHDLQALVKASPATVRRDLRILEDQGRIVRVHGGVVHPNYLEGEPSFAQKSREAVVAKSAIAEEALSLVPPGASVFVDSGTTCLEVGRRLLARKDLTLFTNSVPLAALGGSRAARVICIGGEVREVSRALVGALALTWLGHIRFDVAVIGASGLCPEEGITTTELSEASVKQKLVQRSGTRILVADSSKWGVPRSIAFGRWEEFQYWITDGSIPAEAIGRIGNRGVSVRVARLETRKTHD